MFPPQPFGFVAGKWVLSKGDTTADEDREPDYIPVTEGALTFTPVLPHRTVEDPTDYPSGYAGILNTPVQGILNARGQLIDAEGEPHLALAIGRYRVTYDFGLTSWPDHDIEVTPEHTLARPLWIPTASPIPTGPGIVQVVTEEARLAAEAAATSAETAALAATLAALAAETAAAGITALNTLRVDTTVGTRIIATINGQDHMIHGDTGPIDATPYLVNGWKKWGSFPLTLQRVGNRVYLQGMIDGTQKTGPTFLNPPPGYRPTPGARTYPGAIYNWDTGTPSPVGAERSSIASDFAPAARYTAPLSWPTDDLWLTA